MKIAILAPSHSSFIKEFLPNHQFENLSIGYAGATFVGTIIKELLLRNHEVIAITTNPANDGKYEIQKFTNNKFTWYVVPSRPNSFRLNGTKLGRIVDFFSYEVNLMSKILIDLKPDIVHSFWSYEFTAAAKQSQLPFLATIEDNAFVILKYFKNFYRLGRLIMSERILKNVKHLTTVSPYMVNYCKRHGANVKVIPNPTPIIYKNLDIDGFIQARIEQFPQFKIVMINNGWDTRKNGKCGLLAFKLLLDRYPQSTLHLFGSGSEKDGLANKDANSMNLKGIQFWGTVSKETIISNLKTAHLFLHPALEESFGVVIIEAMALGVPVIGGEKSGGVPWVVNDNDLLVDVTNHKTIGAKIISILSDKKLYTEKSVSVFKQAENKYSSENVVDAFEKYYYEIMKSF